MRRSGRVSERKINAVEAEIIEEGEAAQRFT